MNAEELTSVEHLLQEGKDIIEAICGMFDSPGDDFHPVVVMVKADGMHGLVAIDPSFMTDANTKDLLAYEVLPGLLREQEAVGLCFSASAWTVRDLPPEEKESIQEQGIRNDPRRVECVFVNAITKDKFLGSMAMIVRSDTVPPMIGEWEDWPESADSMEGRFVGPLREALV
jgi:hypothetical protein